MTKQTASEFINELTTTARKNVVLHRVGRGMTGEGKAEGTLPDGKKVICTFSQSVRIYGRDVLRSSFTIDGKRASKEQIAAAMGEGKASTADLNPILRAAFEAQAPELAQDYEAHITRVFETQNEKFGGKIPAYPLSRMDAFVYHLIRETLSPVCDTVKEEGDLSGMHSTLRLNREKLAHVAKKYAEEVSVQWFYKTNEKLGALDDAELLRDCGGDVVVKGTRDGKKIEMIQQRIMKSSPKGRMFHQFPARLYCDDKFVTEAAYKKMFKKD